MICFQDRTGDVRPPVGCWAHFPQTQSAGPGGAGDRKPGLCPPLGDLRAANAGCLLFTPHKHPNSNRHHKLTEALLNTSNTLIRHLLSKMNRAARKLQRT